jgi:polyhydroxyalkanoate synthase
MPKKQVKTSYYPLPEAEDAYLPEAEDARGPMARAGIHSAHLLKRAVLRPLRRSDPRRVSIRGIVKPYMRFYGKLATQPDTLLSAQVRLWRDITVLWTSLMTANLLLSNRAMQVAQPERGDKRFRDIAWRDLPFNAVQQYYLLSSRWILDTIAETRGLDEHSRHKLRFFTSQLTAAMAPSNFLLSNPQALQATLESGGKNLLNGLANLLRDLDEGRGALPFRITDPDAFVVGGNLANTPGQVIYQNELMQLIQYDPATERVHRRPLLVIPPWINKYYILDLGEDKSLLRYWVEQGHTVFVISWVNPSAELGHKGFEDYMFDGPLAAMDAIEQATGERDLNAVGYCIGGTLLGSTLAWMAKRGDDRIASATFLNSLLEFSEVGDIAAFIDEDMLRRLEKAMNRQGYLPGESMGTAFSMLQPDNLMWFFFINNYLLGKETPPLDLLYWNCDSTRLPAAMHSFYLRNMYLHNRLCQPGGIELAGVPIDLGRVNTPCYFVSTIGDHIAPWVSCYQGARYLGGPVRFVLGGSGHIAGIINPPSQNKYGYWTNENTDPPPQEWLDGADKQEGSWWPDWVEWAQAFGGGEVAARTPGTNRLPAIEPAPGSYVRNQPAPPTPGPEQSLRLHRRKKTGTPRKASR